MVEAVYRTQQGERKSRRLQPVGLLFSEFYFYLTAFIEGIDRAEHFENADDPFPTIYRVDRIENAPGAGRALPGAIQPPFL